MKTKMEILNTQINDINNEMKNSVKNGVVQHVQLKLKAKEMDNI